MLEALRVDDYALVRLADCADPETRRVDYLAAQELCRNGQLVCPACALFGAKGEIYPRRDTGPGHWAHHPRGDKGCPRHTEPMSVAHYLAQLHIQQTLRTRYPQANVQLETRLGPGQTAGRGDITVQLADGRQLCIEVQRSKMSPGHVQERIQNREAAGWAIDWVFIIEADDLHWSKPLVADSMLRTALERRGYIYLLEDPYAPDPVLRVAVHRDLNRFISRLHGGTLPPLPESLAHVLEVKRPLSEFHVTPAGLRHPKLQPALERWIDRGLRKLKPPPFIAPQRTADAVVAWQVRRDALARDLSDATTRVRSADKNLRGSENEQRMATTSLVEADAERARTRLLALRRSKRRELDARRVDAAQWLLAAQERLRDARDASKRAHAARQRIASTIAAHDLGQSAAEQADREHHETQVDTARARHDASYNDEHALVRHWLAQLRHTGKPPVNAHG